MVTVLVLALTLVTSGGPGVVSFDSLYSLVWGHELVNGRVPLRHPDGAPTPHPMGLVVGVVVASSGLPAESAMLAVGVLGWVVSLITFALAAALMAQVGVCRLGGRERSGDAGGDGGRSVGRASRSDRVGAPPRAPRRRVPFPNTTRPTPGQRFTRLSTGQVAGPLAAVLTIVVLLASPTTTLLAKTGSLDLLYTACIGTALLLQHAQRRGTAYGFLTLASLERPEAWVVLIAVIVLDRRHRKSSESPPPPGAGSAYRGGGRLRDWVLVLIAPAAWLASGGLFGDPLMSATVTTANAEAFDDPVGLGYAITSLPSDVASGIGWPVLAAGVCAAAGLAITSQRARPRRSVPTTTKRHPGRHSSKDASSGAGGVAVLLGSLLLVVTVTSLAYLATGAAGATPIPRYLLGAQLCVVVLFAGALSALTEVAWSTTRMAPHYLNGRADALTLRLVAGLVLVGVAAGLVYRTDRYADLTSVLTTQHRVNTAITDMATSISESSPSSCRSIATPSVAQLPVLAAATGDNLKRYGRFIPPETTASHLIYPRNPVAALNAGYGPVLGLETRLPIPAGYKPTFRNQYWAAFSRC